jgi:uncharacterized protein (TIGR03067 family)
MPRILPFALLLSFATVSAVGQSQRNKEADPKNNIPSIAGTYTIASGERDGRAIAPDRLVGTVVTIDKDRILGVDKNKKEFLDVRYTIDTTSKPWVLRMRATLPAAGETTGLVEKDEDTVRIIYALPEAAAPAEFRTKERQLMFTLRVANKGGLKTYEPTIKK